MLKWVEINLKTLAGNAGAIRKALRPGVSFMAVVKADGYGHGAAAVAQIALKNGADSLGALTAQEGAALRQIFPTAQIHLLAPSLPEEARAIIKNRLIPCVDSLDFIRELDRFAAGAASYNLEIDLGLRRWGLDPAAAGPFLRRALAYKKAKPRGLCGHLAYRPPQNMIEAEEKLSVLNRLAADLRKLAPDLKTCAANSAILCDFPQWQLDMVRIGNLLYGIYPTDIYRKKRCGPPLPGLARPWQFYARIVAVKAVKKGEALGYASEFVAPRAMRVAAIPAGYSDGLTMEPTEPQIRITAGFRYWGLINGKKAFFAGKAGISHTLLDVTNIPEAKPGAAVALHVRRTAANAKIPRVYK